MNRKVFLWILLAVAVFAGCKKPEKLQVSAESPSDWTEIATDAYTLRHPQEVLVDRSHLMGTELVVFLVNPPVPNQFVPNINLLVQDLKGKKVDLDQYTEISKNQVNTMMPNSRILESVRKKGVKGEYQKFVYTGDQMGYHLQFEQFYTIADGKAYILTLTCEEKLFDRCRSRGESIMNAFALR